MKRDLEKLSDCFLLLKAFLKGGAPVSQSFPGLIARRIRQDGSVGTEKTIFEAWQGEGSQVSMAD